MAGRGDGFRADTNFFRYSFSAITNSPRRSGTRHANETSLRCSQLARRWAWTMAVHRRIGHGIRTGSQVWAIWHGQLSLQERLERHLTRLQHPVSRYRLKMRPLDELDVYDRRFSEHLGCERRAGPSMVFDVTTASVTSTTSIHVRLLDNAVSNVRGINFRDDPLGLLVES
ncbi:hypothetical protein D9613_001277 [Agrocybe pediades]|uniref:Uncharacterized protein n=1 Tax=Agrocybe pediades TaxID=84607 RepID=A0A8H4R6Z2_9AGAR|nr:hypothetical protein D9613_001277 [Agrocybe pediades]